MDTKWNVLNKPLYLFISIACFILSFGLINCNDMSMEKIFGGDPFKSRWLYEKFDESFFPLYDLIVKYGSEESIRTGASLDEEQVYETMKELSREALRNNGYTLNEDGGGLVIEYDSDSWNYSNEEELSPDLWDVTPATVEFTLNGQRLRIIQGGQAQSYESSRMEYGESGILQSESVSGVAQSALSAETPAYFAEAIPDDNVLTYSSVYDFVDSFREPAREINISRQLEYFREQLHYIGRDQGFVYFFKNGGDVITNLGKETLETEPDQYIESLPVYYIYSPYNQDSNIEHFSDFSRMSMSNLARLDTNYFFAMGFDEALFSSFAAKTASFRFYSLIVFILCITSGLSTLLFGALAALFSGRSFYEDRGNGPVEKKSFSPKKFLYADLSLVLMIAAFSFSWMAIASSANIYSFSDFMTFSSRQIGIIFTGSLIAVAAAALMFISFYSIVFSVKSRELSEHLLILKILKLLVHFIETFAGKGRVRFYIISNRNFDRLLSGMDRILEGDFQSPIIIRGRGKAAKLAERINRVSDGFNTAVENRMKSERLKTELISNVSHDIRTPLTSIVTYVDLLKKDAADEDRTRYLEVLESKTARLKTLIDDLFDASKASSGNISTEMERLDLHYVMEQAMGEIEDKLEASSLQFILNCQKEQLCVMADGGLLWRVIHNLFSNIFKYSMANSRVYIDVYAEDANVHMTFKNISAYELNISADELMERFTRGDRSRNSEGSGLGLTIARSLTESMGGTFELGLDGDLFKVSLSFPAV